MDKVRSRGVYLERKASRPAKKKEQIGQVEVSKKDK
jgi:hypothetical protein